MTFLAGFENSLRILCQIHYGLLQTLQVGGWGKLLLIQRKRKSCILRAFMKMYVANPSRAFMVVVLVKHISQINSTWRVVSTEEQESTNQKRHVNHLINMPGNSCLNEICQ